MNPVDIVTEGILVLYGLATLFLIAATATRWSTMDDNNKLFYTCVSAAMVLGMVPTLDSVSLLTISPINQVTILIASILLSIGAFYVLFRGSTEDVSETRET